VHEPRRLWKRYLIGNTKFVAAVARQRLRNGAQLASASNDIATPSQL